MRNSRSLKLGSSSNYPLIVSNEKLQTQKGKSKNQKGNQKITIVEYLKYKGKIKRKMKN